MGERITREPLTIVHDRAHAGQLAHYFFGLWMTNTHKPGRWNDQPLIMKIAIAGELPPT